MPSGKTTTSTGTVEEKIRVLIFQMEQAGVKENEWILKILKKIVR